MLVAPFAQTAGQACENAPFSLLPGSVSPGALWLSQVGFPGYLCSLGHIFICLTFQIFCLSAL